jgi:hypothetical protein
MCERPCWGTPDEIARIIDAGHADRLSLDWWDTCHGDIPVLAPAERGYEGRRAANWPSGAGCTFFANGRCLLHTSRLKPMEGRVARHDRPRDEYMRVKEWIVAQWETARAAELIARWKTMVWYDRQPNTRAGL